MSENQSAAPAAKHMWLHKLFGSKPGDGEMQPKEGLAFSICGFGQNMICTIVGSYLTLFMTDAIGFPAIWVALLMLFARIYDAANDPIMGSIVDRTRTKWGKCRPYLKWMAIPIMIMTILCFLPWYPNSPGGFAAVTIVYLIWGMVYTVADVPYWGLSTAMSNDTYRRGNMLTIARLFCTVGAGLVTIIVPQIDSALTGANRSIVDTVQSFISQIQLSGEFDVDKLGIAALGPIQEFLAKCRDLNVANLADLNKAWAAVGGLGLKTDIVTGADLQNIMTQYGGQLQTDLKWIYFVAAIVCCVVALPLFYVGFKHTKERNQSLENPPSLGHNLKLLFKNKPLMLIVLSGIGGAARMLFTYTGGLYFAKYVFADRSFLGMQGTGLYTLFNMAIVPGGLIASVMVPFFTKKFGKRNTYIWSHIVGGVAMLIAFIVGIATDKGDYSHTATFVVLLLALVIAGVPVGFGNILTYAMIGDTVEYLELKTGERAEGICFAMQTLINKVGMAIGAFVGVLAYSMADITPNNPGALDASGKDTMWIMLMLVAAISFFLTVIPLFFYKFNEKQQQEAVEQIKLRKAAAAEGADGNVEAVNAAENGFAAEAVLPNENSEAVPIEGEEGDIALEEVHPEAEDTAAPVQEVAEPAPEAEEAGPNEDGSSDPEEQ